MFRTIVWATDGSEAAELARATAVGIAAATGARLVVVHHDQHYLGRIAGLSMLSDEDERVARIRRDVEELQRAGREVELVLRSGSRDPADVVAEVADEVDADLIVCGTRGLGTFTGAMVGSVSHRLLHVAPCPVLVASKRAARLRERELDAARPGGAGA